MGCIYSRSANKQQIDENNIVGNRDNLLTDDLTETDLTKDDLTTDNLPQIEQISSFENSTEHYKKLFEKSHYENTKSYISFLHNKLFTCRVVDVYDGDTITCIINIYDAKYLVKIRLLEIDTCEMKSVEPKAKYLAYKGRQRMFELITGLKIDLTVQNKIIRQYLKEKVYLVNILCGNTDIHGRLLGYVFKINDEIEQSNNSVEKSLNYILLKEKLAYKYTSDNLTKPTEEEQINLLYNNSYDNEYDIFLTEFMGKKKISGKKKTGGKK